MFRLSTFNQPQAVYIKNNFYYHYILVSYFLIPFPVFRTHSCNGPSRPHQGETQEADHVSVHGTNGYCGDDQAEDTCHYQCIAIRNAAGDGENW